MMQKMIKQYLNLSEIKKGNKKHRSEEQKMCCIILKCFTKQGIVLLNFLMIIH